VKRTDELPSDRTQNNIQTDSNGDVPKSNRPKRDRGDVNDNLRLTELSSEPEDSGAIYMKSSNAGRGDHCAQCCVLS
jgi:hypothetical protein